MINGQRRWLRVRLIWLYENSRKDKGFSDIPGAKKEDAEAASSLILC
jgi:hypothetical protein